jgi:proteic killer suppression protein
MKSIQRNALVFRTGFSVRVFLDELEVLDAAEKLLGKREGQHSIRINDQWRICFR